MMKKALGIFVLALVAVHSTNMDAMFFDSIKSTEFGKTILQTIQIELRTNSKDAIQNILDILAKIRSQIQDEETRDTNAFKALKTRLEGEITQLNKDIVGLNRAIRADRRTRRTKSRRLRVVKASLKRNEGLLKAAKDKLKEITDQRKKEHQEYLKQSAKIADLIKALNEGLEIIKTLLNAKDAKASQTLAELPMVFSQISNQLEKIRYKDAKLAGFVLNLGQILSKQNVADQGLVQKVVDIINELIDDLTGDLADLTKKETQLKEIFDEKSVSLQADINRYTSKVNQLSSEKSSLEAAIAGLTNRIRKNVATRKNKIAERTAKKKELSDETDGYNQRHKERTTNLATLDKVEEIVKTRIAKAKEYLKTAVF